MIAPMATRYERPDDRDSGAFSHVPNPMRGS